MRISLIILLSFIWAGGAAASLLFFLCRYMRATGKISACADCVDMYYQEILRRIVTENRRKSRNKAATVTSRKANTEAATAISRKAHTEAATATSQKADTEAATVTSRKANTEAMPENGQATAVRLKTGTLTNMPMSFGIFRKTILLPQKTYTDEQLLHILRHEYTHFLNHDMVKKTALSVVCCIFWWFPPIYPMKRIFEQAIEVKCDADVTDGMEPEEKAAYLNTIVETLRYAKAGGNAEILERFRMVLGGSAAGKGLLGICLLLIGERVSRRWASIKKSLQNSITLLTLLRAPLKTALTFLLIASASFALFSRAADYAVTVREARQAERFYHGVAVLEQKTGDVRESAVHISSPDGSAGVSYGSVFSESSPHRLTEEERERFQNLPGVTLLDTRYQTAGMVEASKGADTVRESAASLKGGETMQAIPRMNGFDEYAHFPVVFEGTYAGCRDEKEDPSILTGHVRLAFDDIKVIACEKEIDLGDHFELADTPLGDNFYAESVFTGAYFDRLKVGSRCLVLGDYTGYQFNDVRLSYSEGEDALRVIDGLTEDYLETEAFARQRGWVEVIRYNTAIYDMEYTADARAIPAFNDQSMYLKEGRFPEAGQQNACLVSETFLRTNNLSVGDSLRVRLGDRMTFGSARVFEKEDIAQLGDAVTLEIVGAYEIEPTANVIYSENSIFVPSALQPYETLRDHTNLDDVCFFVEQAKDIEAFYNAIVPIADELDQKLTFSDRGWLDVKDSLRMGAFTSLLTTLLYLLGASLALLLAVYLYVGRSRKDFAIMRTLGVPAQEAEYSVMMPFVFLAAVSMPLGAAAGILYAGGAAEKALAKMAESAPLGYVPNTGLPAAVILLCLLLELGYVSLLTCRFLRRMRNTPPLVLLQEAVQWAGDDKNAASEQEQRPAGEFHAASLPASPVPKSARTYGAFRQVTAYILCRMRRCKGRTAVSLLLTVVLAGGICMFVLARLMYHDAFYALKVTGKMEKFTFSTVSELASSPLVNDFYCRKDFEVRVRDREALAPMCVTNDFARAMGGEATVIYGDGHDASDFEGTASICLIGEGLAERLGVSCGDEICMMSDDLYYMLSGLGSEEEREQAENSYKTYQIVGIVEAGSAGAEDCIYTGLRQNVDWLFGMIDFPMDECEFLVAENDRVEELQTFLEEELQRKHIYMPEAGFHIDRGGLAHIDRIRGLLEALFPIAVAGAVLIGLFGPFLVILQSAREAAFLRVLGVTKRRVRCMLIGEQAILCAAGLLLLTGAMAAWRGDLLVRGIGTLGACGMLYALSCVCGASAAAVQVTRYRIMELLQGKE